MILLSAHVLSCLTLCFCGIIPTLVLHPLNSAPSLVIATLLSLSSHLISGTVPTLIRTSKPSNGVLRPPAASLLQVHFYCFATTWSEYIRAAITISNTERGLEETFRYGHHGQIDR